MFQMTKLGLGVTDISEVIIIFSSNEESVSCFIMLICPGAQCKFDISSELNYIL